MGYESKVYICNPISKTFWEEIVSIELCCMGNGFMDINWKPLPNEDKDDLWERPFCPREYSRGFHSAANDCDTKPLKVDCYGDPLKWSKLDEVLAYCYEQLAKGEDYRRLILLKNTLESAAECFSHSLVVVHYGY